MYDWGRVSSCGGGWGICDIPMRECGVCDIPMGGCGICDIPMCGLGMYDISMSGVDAWQCPHAWIGNVVTSQSRHWEFGDIQVHALGRLRRLNADMADGEASTVTLVAVGFGQKDMGLSIH